ncbi:MAG: ferritin-like domain-containing protein [Acidobacteria bacterium]|nr:MAG: ferritin-like domain-containing protein [Acidobacteriota bacterium]PYV86849.1 MAG: ferritin-like domain-containing protein [Acidobacteriota bacterium]
MKAHSLKELFIEELRDLYDAENQLTKALPKMAEGSSSPELREAFEEHLEQTRNHVSRLEKVFAGLGEKPKAEKCKGMEGLIKEGSELLKEDDFDSEVKDAAIIGAAQKVEHYEIAGYGTVRTFAELLGEDEAVSLLEETLEEEKETDQKLTELADQINVEASEGEDAESEDIEGEELEADQQTAKRGRTSRKRPAA